MAIKAAGILPPAVVFGVRDRALGTMASIALLPPLYGMRNFIAAKIAAFRRIYMGRLEKGEKDSQNRKEDSYSYGQLSGICLPHSLSPGS